MRLKRLTLLGALFAVLAVTTALASIGPAGPVIPVNTDTANFESYPDVAAQPGGSYTVVWSVGPPGNAIRSRRFDSADQPLGGEKLVSTSSEQEDVPAVAAAPDGSLVVAWESTTGDDAVFQRLEADGDKLGGEVAAPESESGGYPDVAVAADGTFVVVWSTLAGVSARRFAANGTPLTGDVEVGDGDANSQPSVSIDSAGRVFIAWDDLADCCDAWIRGFSATLAPAWDAKRVISGTTESLEPDVVATPEGFVVVFNQADDANQAYGRRFTPDGAPVAAAVPLSPADGREPHVARGADGGLVVGWWDGADGLARAFRSDLSAAGGAIVVADDGPSPQLAAFSGQVIAVYHVVVPGQATTSSPAACPTTRAGERRPRRYRRQRPPRRRLRRQRPSRPRRRSPSPRPRSPR